MPLDRIDAKEANADPASRRLHAAARGLKKHAPVRVRRNGHRFEVLDGHDVVAAARKHGWRTLRAAIDEGAPVEKAKPADEDRGHRYITIHEGDHKSAGHAVRMVPHPDKPGRWTIHPEDRKKARLVLKRKASRGAQQGGGVVDATRSQGG